MSSFLTPSTGFLTGSLRSGDEDEGIVKGTCLNGMKALRTSSVAGSVLSTGLIGGVLCGLAIGDFGGVIDGLFSAIALSGIAVLFGSEYSGEYLTGL